MKRLIATLLLLLCGAGLVYASSLQQHSLPNGKLLEGVAFENGDALTVSLSRAGNTPQLIIGYYNATGEMQDTIPLSLQATPETLILHACGAYLQVFVGYPASVPNDPTTAMAERFIWELPTVQGCFVRDFLPLILGGA